MTTEDALRSALERAEMRLLAIFRSRPRDSIRQVAVAAIEEIRQALDSKTAGDAEDA